MLRNHNLLNPRLVSYLASAGHTDVVVVADAGLPMPGDVPVVDLSLVPGNPSFQMTTEVVLRALAVESAVVAEETRRHEVGERLFDLLDDIPVKTVTHESFKQLTRHAHVIVRTGECSPFANVALVAGVMF